MKIELTKTQCYNLSLFIRENLLDDIRKDPDMDNLDYLRDLLDAEKAFREATRREIT